MLVNLLGAGRYAKRIYSTCDTKKVRNAAIENGGNQVAVLGLIIEEIGRRKVRNAAPVVVEYVAWPYYDDFLVHLVPHCFKSLCELGDDSIVERLLQLTCGDIATKKLLDFLYKLPPDLSDQDRQKPYDSDPSADLQSRIIMTALEEALVDRDAIKKWADNEIIRISYTPPGWLCELSLHGQLYFRHAPEDKEIYLVFEEKYLLYIAFYKDGRMTLVETVERICRGALGGYHVGIKALANVLYCLAFQHHVQISQLKLRIEEQFERVYEQRPLIAKTTKGLLSVVSLSFH